MWTVVAAHLTMKALSKWCVDTRWLRERMEEQSAQVSKQTAAAEKFKELWKLRSVSYSMRVLTSEKLLKIPA